MSEETAIERVEEPVTVDRLVGDLRDLGVAAGDTLLVHASLSELGWVAGGAQAVAEALRAAVTPDGTVVVPTFTGQYTDPATWSSPPVPETWVERIPDDLPPFRPAVTPSRAVGAVPECLRCHPDARRSDHPTVSFAAWGAAAEPIVADHPLDDPLGEGSPLARLNARDADVLFLGTDHATNTSFHLAEYRADIETERTTTRATVRRDGEPVMVSVEDQVLSTDDFPAVGSAFEEAVGLASGPVAAAPAKLASQPAMVDFAVDRFERTRPD